MGPRAEPPLKCLDRWENACAYPFNVNAGMALSLHLQRTDGQHRAQDQALQADETGQDPVVGAVTVQIQVSHR